MEAWTRLPQDATPAARPEPPAGAALARQARRWELKATLLEIALGATAEAAYWPQALAALRHLFDARHVTWWVAGPDGLMPRLRSPERGEWALPAPAAVLQAAIDARQVQTMAASDAEGVTRLCLLGPVKGEHGIEGVLQLVLESAAMRPEQAEELTEALAHVACGLASVRRLERLAYHASHDPLTGLANRRTFEQAAARELKLARRHGTPLSLLVIDMDHFKSYNDTYGHPAGDELLRLIATTLRESVRSTDFIGRFGGEEFVILLPHTDAAGARRTADKVLEAVRSLPRRAPVRREQLSASIGLATCDNTPCDWLALLDAADQALYRAKHGGRDQVCSA